MIEVNVLNIKEGEWAYFNNIIRVEGSYLQLYHGISRNTGTFVFYKSIELPAQSESKYGDYVVAGDYLFLLIKEPIFYA